MDTPTRSNPIRTRQTRLPLLAIPALALLAACESDRPQATDSSLATTFDTVGGVVHVTNTGEAPAWQLVQVLSIGPDEVTDDGGPEEFGDVAGVARGPGGELFVGDAYSREVRVFGPDGRHLRTFGRNGEGPGEFSAIYSLAWIGGRLLVWDPPMGRLNQFSVEGEWLGNLETRRGWTGPRDLLRLYPVNDNEVFRLGLSADLESIWVGYAGEGESGDTLPLLTVPDGLPGNIESVMCESDLGIGFYAVPLAPQFIQHPASGRVMVSAWGWDYRIVRTTLAGDTLRVVERTVPPVPIDDAEWAEIGVAFEEFLATWINEPGANCSTRNLARPERKPFVHNIFMAGDGGFWVEAAHPGGNRFDRFDAEGRVLGSVAAPEYNENTVPVFVGDHIITIRQDKLDLDHVELWRVEW